MESLIGRDEFSYLVSCIDKNFLFAFSLTCKSAHKAVLDLNLPIMTTYKSQVYSIPLLEWAMDNGCPSKEYIWAAEAGNKGNLDVLSWICKRPTPSSWSYAVDNVAFGGHLHILEWAHEDKNKELTSIYKYSALGGHIHVLEWALKKKIWVGDGDHYDFSEVTNAAAESGQYDVLNFLRKNGFEWDSWTCAGAARGGHLEVLKWLRAEGCEWDGNVYLKAAEAGHLDIIKWAYENGLSRQEHCDMCGYAAKGGHLAVLQWAHANGFPWGRFAMWWAAYYNQLEILKWVHANGCVCNETRSNRLRFGYGMKISREVIQWVEENLGRI